MASALWFVWYGGRAVGNRESQQICCFFWQKSCPVVRQLHCLDWTHWHCYSRQCCCWWCHAPSACYLFVAAFCFGELLHVRSFRGGVDSLRWWWGLQLWPSFYCRSSVLFSWGGERVKNRKRFVLFSQFFSSSLPVVRHFWLSWLVQCLVSPCGNPKCKRVTTFCLTIERRILVFCHSCFYPYLPLC